RHDKVVRSKVSVCSARKWGMSGWPWTASGHGIGRGGGGGVRGREWGQNPRPTVELKQNFPNPFNPATTIPFSLGGDLFANGHRPKVSLKIYNVLAQLVAVPILQGTGEALDNLELVCSSAEGCAYSAYWDCNVRNT